MVIDGPVLVREALDSRLTVDAVFVEATAAGTGDIAALVDRAEAGGIDVWLLADGALARLTAVMHPPGVAAIARWTPAPLPEATATSMVLVLAGLADPGNAGTLLRTAEAAGATAVVFCEKAVDPTNPKCVRASAGALFRTPVVVGGSLHALLDDLGRAGYRRLATQAAGAAIAYDRADLTGRVAIVLGSEPHGLPAGIEASIDEHITIPMVGGGESLNVAMAGSIICFEALRQRRSSG